MTEFEPRIVGFLCNWCSYAGADLAGVSRFQYPTNIRIVRVMCSGRVEPSIILGILARGADGVLVTGCHIGDCHYIDGNLQARRKCALAKKLVEKAGLEGGRVRLEWVSAAEGQRFAGLVKEFTEQVKALGPSPLLGEQPEKMLRLNLRAAKEAAEFFRLRALVAKEEKLVTEGDVYGSELTQKDFDDKMFEAVESEYDRHRIRLALIEEPSSVIRLSDRLSLEPRKVLEHIVSMRQRGWIEVNKIQGKTPLYRALEVLP